MASILKVEFRALADSQDTLTRLKQILWRLVPGTSVTEKPSEAQEEPTIRINTISLPAEAPEWMIEAGVLRALEPRHLLFLCVANSARSQMAEGIARELAPPGVQLSSAGSKPTAVRMEAVKVLQEIGIDISKQSAKAVAAVDADSVDAVITLCQEQTCPAYLGKGLQLHWALEDPAQASGEEAGRLAAFRRVRDEILARLRVLFSE